MNHLPFRFHRTSRRSKWPDQIHLELERAVAVAGGEQGGYGAPHRRVEEGADQATLHHSDRVVQVLARLERHHHSAAFGDLGMHAQQGARWRYWYVSPDNGLNE